MTTAEEKFNSNALYAMEHIMELVLYTPKSRPIEYKIDFLQDNRKLSVEREVQILEKLQEFKTIEIVSDNEVPNSVMPEARVIFLAIRQPKFDDYYQELKKPFRKIEKYKEFSAESIKQIAGILKKVKEEYNFATPENSTNSRGYAIYHTNEKQTSIPQNRYWGWMRECEIDFNRLESILIILQEEGLIKEFKSVNEYM